MIASASALRCRVRNGLFIRWLGGVGALRQIAARSRYAE